MKHHLDEALLKYGTERQQEVYRLYCERGTRKAAKHLNVSERNIRATVERIRNAATRAGYNPEYGLTREAAPGFLLKGHSDFVNEEEGKLSRRWYKYDADKERQWQMIMEAFNAMAEELPKVAASKPPKNTLADLLNQYTLTDYHLGCLAWGEETGAAWDLKIAEDMLIDWFAHAIEMAPSAETAIFAQLGDHAHYDGLLPVTPTSGHILDADSRYQKIIRVLIRSTRQIIKMLLAKHKRVIVLMAEGNHDMSVSMASREWLHAMYEDEPRITIDRNPRPYYCHQHGLVMLSYHHGHKKKMGATAGVMAAMYPEVWGQTKFRYCHRGHYHHDKLAENDGMTEEQHQTLAAPDAHAARGGYISNRSAKVITYHKQHGEVSRLTLTPDMVRRKAA